jgi:transposase
MRENDGRKLDHKTLEALRLRAVERVNSGARPEDVAAALGLHRKTVYGWLAKYRDGGPGGFDDQAGARAGRRGCLRCRCARRGA